MGSWIVSSENKGNTVVGSGLVANILAVLRSDAEADLPTTNAFSGYVLYKGSTCHCVLESTDWMLDSTGTWRKQISDNSVSIDLTGYYTSAQVDQAIADALRAFIAGDDIPANYDLNDFVTVGHRNCSAVNAQTCSNRPLGTQNGGFGVTNTIIYSTSGSADRVKQELVYNVTGSNIARNRTFWRYNSSAGWSDWYEVTTSVVTI